MREMRELENMGAHSALLKMTRYLRRYEPLAPRGHLNHAHSFMAMTRLKLNHRMTVMLDNSYQRTIDMVFDAEDEEGDEYVISQDEIVAYFQRAYVTR